MPYFGIFRLEFQKTYCNIWNQHSGICLIANIREKLKILKFGHSVAVLNQYSHISNLHPRICLTAKFSGTTKRPKNGTKNALLGYFGARILKKLLFYLKSAASNLTKCKTSQK